MFQINKTIAKAMRHFLYALMLPFFCLAPLAYAVDDHGHDKHEREPHSQREKHKEEQVHGTHQGEHGHEERSEGPVTIGQDIAEQSHISVATVQPQALEIVTQAFGKLVIPPNQEAHIHARFPGLVKDIKVQVGDRVTKGDVLAVIESNESLQNYTVEAPMSGTVTQRQLNLGEITDDGPLVVIVDENLLWAELKIFPHQRQQVKQGQTVHFSREERELTTKITHLAPSAHGAPYMLARALVDNSEQRFTPGELLRADIVVDTATAAVAVENRALQMLEGQRVVFIQNGDRYERRSLKLGRTDGLFTEVLAGIQSGETYVTENSYLIKADIEKAGAGHHH